MSRTENKSKEASPDEIREAARQDWLLERQTAAVAENEPIKDVFRVTVAIDVVKDDVEKARAAVKDLKGEGVFVYGIKGVRRLESLFKTSEDFKRITEKGKQAK